MDGGGIVSYWYITPVIRNCTIVDNKAEGPADTNWGRGGGLSCSYESRTELIDSILWGNTAGIGNQIAIGSDSDPLYVQRPAELTVLSCDIEGWSDPLDPTWIDPNAVFVEPDRLLNWGDANDANLTPIDADPLFVAGYYLSHVDANQDANSPCVDAGSGEANDANIGMDMYTTRTDGVNDVGRVDIGLHYPADERYRLTVNVISAHGTVDPNGGLFNKYAVIKLTATADAGYRARWTGTDDDSSTALTNTVTMYSDRTVTVKFEMPRTIRVPGNYPTIQAAIDAASDGDVVVVNRGTWRPGGLVIQGKAIVLQSSNPEDPCTVAETVIDGAGYGSRGLFITRDCGPDTVINGLAFANHGWGRAPSMGGLNPGDDGGRGNDSQGAGIWIDAYGSPTIINCIVRNIQVRAGDAGDGVDGGEDPNDPNADPPWFTGDENGGNGGDGGTSFGGGIYCGPYSSPTIRNCIVYDCNAEGGNGGNAGAGVSPAGEDSLPSGNGGHGGNGGRGGGAYGGGIYVGLRSRAIIDGCLIKDCSVLAGTAGDAADGGAAGADPCRGGNGGIGGENGQAYGGGIYFGPESRATVSDCRIINCSATGGVAGDGGNWGPSERGFGAGGAGGGWLGEFWKDSAHGGGAYCDAK
jgi:hypothetical protein